MPRRSPAAVVLLCVLACAAAGCRGTGAAVVADAPRAVVPGPPGELIHTAGVASDPAVAPAAAEVPAPAEPLPVADRPPAVGGSVGEF